MSDGCWMPTGSRAAMTAEVETMTAEVETS